MGRGARERGERGQVRGESKKAIDSWLGKGER